MPSLVALLVVWFFLTPPYNPHEVRIYSPYQALTLFFQKDSYPILGTNNVYYQRILDLRKNSINNNAELKKWSAYYNLPYHFKPKPENVLVVGSGTGNDVSAAVRNGAGDIDAVEIDPVILALGKKLHKERPYQSNKVHVTVNDARSIHPAYP